MSAIQPSIIARLKPELIAKERQVIRDELDGIIHVSEWQPLEYKDQIIDLQPDEDATPCQTADLGSVTAEVVTRTSEKCADLRHTQIRVQFHHKIEV